MLLNYVLGSLVGLLVSTAAALDLKPMPNPHDVSGHTKRAGNWTGMLELQDFENLYWGAPSGDNLIYANFTVFFPENYRYVIAMEKFAGQLKSVQCSANMTMEFNDAASFNAAKSSWNWVNGDVNNTFIMITDYAGCEDSEEREPFLVSSIAYDDAHNKVLLNAKKGEWEDLAHTYSINIGQTPMTPVTRRFVARHLAPRGPDYSMKLDSQFNKNLFTATQGDWTSSVDAKLTTGGRLNVDFALKTRLKIIVEGATMTVNPQDVYAQIELALTEKGKLGKAYTWEKTIISIPVEGIKIVKIVSLGAFLDVDVGFTMEQWEGSATANIGAKMSLQNSAKLMVDFLSPKNNVFSGWEPKFEAIPLTVSARVDGAAKVFARPNVRLEASVFKLGYQASLGVELPNLEAKLAGLAATNGVCDSKKTLGVQYDANIGIAVNANIGQINKSPAWSQNLYSKSWPLLSKCNPIGPDNAISGSAVSILRPASSKAASATPKPSGSGAASTPKASGSGAVTTPKASGGAATTPSKPSGTAPPVLGNLHSAIRSAIDAAKSHSLSSYASLDSSRITAQAHATGSGSAMPSSLAGQTGSVVSKVSVPGLSASGYKPSGQVYGAGSSQTPSTSSTKLSSTYANSQAAAVPTSASSSKVLPSTLQTRTASKSYDDGMYHPETIVAPSPEAPTKTPSYY